MKPFNSARPIDGSTATPDLDPLELAAWLHFEAPRLAFRMDASTFCDRPARLIGTVADGYSYTDFILLKDETAGLVRVVKTYHSLYGDHPPECTCVDEPAEAAPPLLEA